MAGAKIPNEILTIILKKVMFSDEPMDLTEFVTHPAMREKHPRFYQLDLKRKSCTCSLCQWMSRVQGYACCLCSPYPCYPCIPPHQVGHLKDWVIANGVSKNFREVGKEAFFSSKTFIIPPLLLRQLHQRRIVGLSPGDSTLLFQRCEHIIYPTRCSGSPSGLLSVLLYRYFERLKFFEIWPHINKTKQGWCTSKSKSPPPEWIPKHLGNMFENLAITVDKVNCRVIFNCEAIERNLMRDEIQE